MARLRICPELWLSPPLLRPSRRSLRPEEGVHDRVPSSGRLLSRLWFCSEYALVPTRSQVPHFIPPDELTIDLLRGIQGCGAAAAIPACVRSSHHTTICPVTHPPSLARYTCPCIPSLQDEIRRICHLWCRCSSGSRCGKYPRRHPHTAFRVSRFFSPPPRIYLSHPLSKPHMAFRLFPLNWP